MPTELTNRLVADDWAYRLLREVGKGASATVWCARQASGGLVVRGTSPLGSLRHAPDGISAARCLVYDDYLGAWRQPESPRCANAGGTTPTFGFGFGPVGSHVAGLGRTLGCPLPLALRAPGRVQHHRHVAAVLAG